MDLKNLHKLFNELFELDDNFIQYSNDYIIDNGLEIVQGFMIKRNEIINSIRTILSNTSLDNETSKRYELKISENTKALNEKCSVIQSELKNRIIKSNNFKSAHLYFHNNQVNPIFIDKTI